MFHNSFMMEWTVEFYDKFEEEFDALRENVREELLARASLLEKFGP